MIEAEDLDLPEPEVKDQEAVDPQHKPVVDGMSSPVYEIKGIANMNTPGFTTTYTGLSSKGRGQRSLFDFRTMQWHEMEAILFEVTYSDQDAVEVKANPDLSEAEA